MGWVVGSEDVYLWFVVAVVVAVLDVVDQQ